MTFFSDPTKAQAFQSLVSSQFTEASMSKVVIPEALPWAGLTAWAATTAYASQAKVSLNGYAYECLTPGTSGATGPSGSGYYISDGTVYWMYIGVVATKAYSDALALNLNETFASSGNLYQVTTAGTTSGATGPSTKVAGTSGTVSYSYLGPQTQPIISDTATQPAGTTNQLNWNAANLTILGGADFVQVGANPRAAISTVSYDGTTKGAGGFGYLGIRTDAPFGGFSYFNTSATAVYVDGTLIAIAYYQGAAANRFIQIDSTGLPRRFRDIRIGLSNSTQVYGYYATGFDSFDAYIPKNPLTLVAVGDSFAEPGPLGYLHRLTAGLGIEAFCSSGSGGTGALGTTTSPARVCYLDRWTQDVIRRAPDIVILQGTGNDATNITSKLYTTAQVLAAYETMIRRVQQELPQTLVIVLGLWNNRGTLPEPNLTINAQLTLLAKRLNVPYLDWSTYISDGGLPGSPSGTGNSLYYTRSDGTHRTQTGDKYSAERLLPNIVNVLKTTWGLNL